MRFAWNVDRYDVRSLFGSSCCREVCEGIGDKPWVSIERCCMHVQRFAEAGDAPQPVRGESESRPVVWMGERVSVSKALKMFRSTAMRKEISAKSTVLRRD